MGLFDKKFCDICGEKIGLLGNRKLDDGNICKNCANKLSPWFTGRKKSALEDIRAQLAYREQNAEKLSSFCETRVLGNNWKLHIDDNQGLLFFSDAKNWQNDNPDLIRFDQITGCTVDVQQNVQTHTDNNAQPGGAGRPPMGGGMNQHGGRPPMGGGMNQHGGRPPMGGGMNQQGGRPVIGGMGMNQSGRTAVGGVGGGTYQTYSYDFYVVVSVNTEWFNEIRFKVNSTSVDSQNTAQYQNMNYEAEQIRDALLSLTQNNVANIAAANAPKTAVICPNCGASTIPDANGCCEYCGGACS